MISPNDILENLELHGLSDAEISAMIAEYEARRLVLYEKRLAVLSRPTPRARVN